jgi:peptidoglycan hydrolase CwlO-like protein
MEYATQFYVWASQYINWGFVAFIVVVAVLWQFSSSSKSDAARSAKEIESLRDFSVLFYEKSKNELEMLLAFETKLQKEFPSDTEIQCLNKKIIDCRNDMKIFEEQIKEYNNAIDVERAKQQFEKKLRQYRSMHNFVGKK